MACVRPFLFCVILLSAVVHPAGAHQYPDFDHSLGFTLGQETVTLEYRIWYGPVLTPGLDLDANGDGRLDEEESYRFLEKTDGEIRSGLAFALDGTPLDLRFLTSTISHSGSYPQISTDIALWYTVGLPLKEGAEASRFRLSVQDTNFAGYGPDRKIVFINTASPAWDIRMERAGETIRFDYAPGEFGLGSGAGTESGNAVDKSALRDNSLTRFLQAGTLGPAMLFTAFATAFILGAGHALSPGHGKAMVAAYLVGTRGRKRDAVILGLVVTFTHVISVILLGLVVLTLSTRVLPEQIFPWLSVASGILVFGTGFLLLVRNIHGHSHHHEHGGTHDAKDDHHHHSAPGILSLLTMGVAGGMVPCPSAMVVLLVSVALNQISLGLSMIVVFSLGLASVLVGIGIAVVSVSGFSSAVSRFAPLVRILPLFGAGLVLILGLAITARGLVDAGIIRIMPF